MFGKGYVCSHIVLDAWNSLCALAVFRKPPGKPGGFLLKMILKHENVIQS